MIKTEEEICPVCNGSGEGMTERSFCRNCRGSGVVIVPVEDDTNHEENEDED